MTARVGDVVTFRSRSPGIVRQWGRTCSASGFSPVAPRTVADEQDGMIRLSGDSEETWWDASRFAVEYQGAQPQAATLDCDDCALPPSAAEPVCIVCNDTRKTSDGHMCTRCPTPCPACADGDGRGPFCMEVHCKCECHENGSVSEETLTLMRGSRDTRDARIAELEAEVEQFSYLRGRMLDGQDAAEALRVERWHRTRDSVIGEVYCHINGPEPTADCSSEVAEAAGRIADAAQGPLKGGE